MRKIRRIVIYSILFLLLCVGVYEFLISFFSIKEVHVAGSNVRVELDERKLPKTLLFFTTEKYRQELLRENPILEDVRFEKLFPSTLVIIPTLRTPFGVLVIPTRRVFVDERGYILSDADTTPSGLPVIKAQLPGVRIGQKLDDPSVLKAIEFSVVMQNQLPIEELTITGSGLFTARSGKLDILFTQDREVATNAATLQTLLAGFRIKGTLPTIIDLRFDKPVVKF